MGITMKEQSVSGHTNSILLLYYYTTFVPPLPPPPAADLLPVEEAGPRGITGIHGPSVLLIIIITH